MNYDLKIYLAGKIDPMDKKKNNWREVFSKTVSYFAERCDCKILFINLIDLFYSNSEFHQYSELEIMNYNLKKLNKCDLVIVNIDEINTNVETAIEIYEAARNHIPVIVYNPYCDKKEINSLNIHPWLKCCITRVENDMLSISDYIVNFYILN